MSLRLAPVFIGNRVAVAVTGADRGLGDLIRANKKDRQVKRKRGQVVLPPIKRERVNFKSSCPAQYIPGQWTTQARNR